MKCKKLFYFADKETGNAVVVFLESKFNFFTRQEDWFLVKIMKYGEETKRMEKKIPREMGEELWSLLESKLEA